MDNEDDESKLSAKKVYEAVAAKGGDELSAR
jgi:hypothetical protein